MAKIAQQITRYQSQRLLKLAELPERIVHFPITPKMAVSINAASTDS